MEPHQIEHHARSLASNAEAIEYLVHAKHFGLPTGGHPEDPPGGNRDNKIAELWTRVEEDYTALEGVYGD